MAPTRNTDGVNDVDDEFITMAKTVKTLSLSERFIYSQVAERLTIHIENSRKVTESLIEERNAVLGTLNHDSNIKNIIESTK